MVLPAWQQFLDAQDSWPLASQALNTTKVRDTTADTVFTKRKRMTPEERHAQILQAAVKVIASRGYWGMSLQDIADEIGITEAALYHYIRSKDDLLTMVMLEAYDTPDADEYNAATAAGIDSQGRRVYCYPRYCLNIVLYNLQRPQMVQLFSMLNGEALNSEHPAHEFFISRYQRNWELVRTMNWALPEGYSEQDLHRMYTLAMSAMDGLQYRWLADSSTNLLQAWIECSDIIFPESTWKGLRDPSELVTSGASDDVR